MKIALYAGSFDPFTLGHLDIVKRSGKVFDKIIVAVLNNSSKNPLFEPKERVLMIDHCLKSILRENEYDVIEFSGLTVDVAMKKEATCLVRGIRSFGNMDYERQMEKMNRSLERSLDTIFFNSRAEFEHISSSFVKEIALLGGDVKQYLPENIAFELNKRLAIVNKH